MPRPAQPKTPAAKPAPQDTVSETIRRFAEPLVYLDPAGPADIETLRTALVLAMICWNLPVYENSNERLYTHTKKALDASLDLVPARVRTCLHQLIADRKSKFANVPFAVLVEVHGTSLEDARIVAEARQATQKSVSEA
jgi:hypothetical protein